MAEMFPKLNSIAFIGSLKSIVSF